MGMDGNKAPRPDGFTFKFAHHFWPEFKGEVMSSLRRQSSIIDFHPPSSH